MASRENHQSNYRAARLELKPLARAVRYLIGSGLLFQGAIAPAWAELPIPRAAWVRTPGGAQTGAAVAALSVRGNRMDIDQFKDRAVYEWERFNIGESNTVNFNQPSSTSIALNNIHQSDPSRILGTLSSNGQVYLYNQNGFVFGRNSRVNANSLVATTMKVTDQVLERGITKVFDNPLPAPNERAALIGDGDPYRKDAGGNYITDAGGNRLKKNITVEAGAELRSDKGGRIMIVAPEVVNAGRIETPEGQTVLAAATDAVYLKEAGGDSGVRGLLVEVKTGGDVRNLGEIAAKQGNITLVGFAVNQSGRLSASTSVNLGGSIRLLAREGGTIQNDQLVATSTTRAADRGDGLGTHASLTFDSGSVTEVLPEVDDPTTAIDEQEQPVSFVQGMGHQVTMKNGSRIVAPSGKVVLQATERPDSPGDLNVKNGSKLTLESGSSIDVSGITGVTLPMERNVVELEVRSFELRDAPVQKSGPLFGEKIRVDIRHTTKNGNIGTDLADISGALGRIERTVAERSTAGGEVELVSEGEVDIQAGAVIDFSGGAVAYEDGYINTTKLLSNGQIFDIGDANPNRRYDGIIRDVRQLFERWGIERVWTSSIYGLGLFERGYVEGRAAGKLAIRANSLKLDGQLRGGTIDGVRQRELGARAKGGELLIDLARATQAGQGVLFVDEKSLISRAQPAEETQPPVLVLEGDYLQRTGVRHTVINSNGTVTIAKNTAVTVPDGGGLSLAADTVEVSGRIVAPSGKIELTGKPDLVQLGTNGYQGRSGQVIVNSGAVLDAAGRWINDDPYTEGEPAPVAVPLDGGVISVKTAADLVVAEDSRLDVRSGAWLKKDGTLVTGSGGEIVLKSQGVLGSNLVLDGELLGHGFERGGSLTLSANEIIVGDSRALNSPLNDFLRPLLLDPGFFETSGFSDYSLISDLRGVRVADDTHLTLQTRNLLLKPGYQRQPTGSELAEISNEVLLPDFQRAATNLSLSHAQTAGLNWEPQGSVTIGRGARIDTDPRAHVSLSSDHQIFVGGTINAPAGKIDLAITPPTGGATIDQSFLRNQGIWLDADSRLLASGTVLLEPNRFRRRLGEVLGGGEVSLTADRGYIVAAPGATIDVSGAVDALDLPVRSGNAGALRYRRTALYAPGGSVSLKSAEGMILDGAAIRGRAAGAPASAGGSLAIEINPLSRNPFPPDQIPPGREFPVTPRLIVVSSRPASRDSFTWEWNEGAPDIPDILNGIADVPESLLSDSGFANVSLTTRSLGTSVSGVVFGDDVNVSTAGRLTLDTPAIGWTSFSGHDTGTVSLSSPFVQIGSTVDQTIKLAPLAGNGNLAVNAGWLDLVGATALGGFNKVTLASERDIRLQGIQVGEAGRVLKGELVTAADLDLRAAQVYPTTLSQFRIAVSGNPDGTLRVFGNGAVGGQVLSAAGQLTVEAPTIVQQGHLLAPFGSIDLNAEKNLVLADGSLTSVSGSGLLVPFGNIQGGLDWVYRLGFENYLIVQGAPEKLENDRGDILIPEKRIQLKGDAVATQKGAVIDISGGGDLFSYEFIPGPGGSSDILSYQNGYYPEKFAVVPGLSLFTAPYDHFESPASGLKAGDSIYLSGTAGLPAGEYALLPAHYALLPGGFLIMPENGTRDLLPGQRRFRVDGAPVVAGYRKLAGTDIRDMHWSGFAVEPGSVARSRSEFQTATASTFFAQKAAREDKPLPVMPFDAGTVSFAAKSALAIEGALRSAAEGIGIGGRVDISSDRLAIVSFRGATATPGVVELLAADLNNLGAQSVLLGGTRERVSGGTRLDVQAHRIEVQENAKLEGNEFLLAAIEGINIGRGAEISALGRSSGGGSTLFLRGDNALIRVSSGDQANVSRSDYARLPGTGSITLEAGSVLRSSGSIALDSVNDIDLGGTIRMDGGSLSLRAGSIALGEVPAGLTGLKLDADDLNELAVDELRLTSFSDVRFYGGFDVDLGRLVVDAAGIHGYANEGRTAALTVDSLVLFNSQSLCADCAGDGSGALNLSARTIELGQGSYDFNGFGEVGLTASEVLFGSGETQLSFDSGSVPGRLTIAAPVMTALSGAELELDAEGSRVDLLAVGTPGDLGPYTGLGARLDVTGGEINYGGRIFMPSGAVNFSAAGNIDFLSGSEIDLSGRTVVFSDRLAFAPGGVLSLSSQSGGIRLDNSSRIDLSGSAQGGDSGQLRVEASQGSVFLDGEIKGEAQAGYKQGRFVLDARDFGGDTFSALAGKAMNAGFRESLSVRQRTGDIFVGAGETIQAHHINLSADQGSIDVAGRLDASGTKKGSISLAAGDFLRLASGSSLIARSSAVNEQGGRVFLSATDSDSDGLGGIEFSDGASIDVTGGRVEETVESNALGSITYKVDGPTVVDGGTGSTHRAGEIHFRVLSDGNGDGHSDDPGVGALAGTILGDDKVSVEALAIVEDDDITTADINSWKAATAAYMASAPVLGGSYQLVPGLEVRSAGDMRLSNDWDLVDWRWNGNPGVLTLRAAGNLALDGRLTDGYRNQNQVENRLQTDYSWSYRLIAGADVTSADVMATGDSGDLTVGDNSLVRTGTGSIDVASGDDITLASPESAIYTGGRATSENRYGSLPASVSGNTFYGEYPVEGGDIRVNARGSITGAALEVNQPSDPKNQLITDWLVRAAFTTDPSGDLSKGSLVSAWAIAIDQPSNRRGSVASRLGFKQGLGALGGGNISVSAQGDVTDLSVMIPTTGKQFGANRTAGRGGISFSSPSGQPSQSILEVNGGGDISVEAGGRLAGGAFYTGRGSAEITAGTITGEDSKQFKSGPVFALGDAAFEVKARGDIHVGTVFNPTLLPQGIRFTPLLQGPFFTTYGDASAVRFTSVSGDIFLHNDVNRVAETSSLSFGTGENFALRIYPATLKAAALGGSIEIGDTFVTYPHPTGTIELLADESILAADSNENIVFVGLSDADPALLSQPLNPARQFASNDPAVKTDALRLQPSGPASEIHALQPVHQGDAEPARFIANKGDIARLGSKALNINTSKLVRVLAGNDIRNVSFNIQHVGAEDLSVIRAGRDFIYPFDRSPDTGQLNNAENLEIRLDGPGALHLVAGRNVDLGASKGVSTVGDTANPALADSGADVYVLAGVSSRPDYEGFIRSYLEDEDLYDADLTSYMHKLTGDGALDQEEALQAFRALPEDKQREFLVAVMFNELKLASVQAAAGKAGSDAQRESLSNLANSMKKAGLHSAADRLLGSGTALFGEDGAGYDRGYRAIGKLFPDGDYKGDIKLFFSKIHTLDDGDINLIAPGGLVNAGLAVSFSGQKGADQLGIVAQRAGAINAMVNGDFLVNQSRVFAMGGDDILIWSSEEDIDAGRGAKSALSAPPPITTFDEKGNPVTEFPPVVSGSGIRTFSPPGKEAGDVYLAAPKGVVDAGEAGIGGNNVTIAATAVIGASNISVSGASVGVPTAPPPPVVPGGVSNATTSATQSAQSASNEGFGSKGDEAGKGAEKNTGLNLLNVEVVGFGNCSMGDVKGGAPGCG